MLWRLSTSPPNLNNFHASASFFVSRFWSCEHMKNRKYWNYDKDDDIDYVMKYYEAFIQLLHLNWIIFILRHHCLSQHIDLGNTYCRFLEQILKVQIKCMWADFLDSSVYKCKHLLLFIFSVHFLLDPYKQADTCIGCEQIYC